MLVLVLVLPRLGPELLLPFLELPQERPPFELELEPLPSLAQPRHRCLSAWVLPPQVANQSAHSPVGEKLFQKER